MGMVLPAGPKRCAECGATENPDGSRLHRHHIDGNHDNDIVENVQWMCIPCHVRHHHIGMKHSAETRAMISAAMKGREITPEWRAKISIAKKGKKRSAEIRTKISAALKGREITAEHRAKIGIANKGHPPWNKGRKLGPSSARTRAKIGIALREYWRRRKEEGHD